MRLFFSKLYLLVACSLLPALAVAQQKGLILNLDAPIYDATARYVENGIRQAEAENASFIILKINTPGGMLDATRKIVGAILTSPVPVISFVTPEGAHAGSAGAFIALAANVCYMSPGTNIGASHPVLSSGSPDSVMNQKMTHDAVAFIRSIADKRGKNADVAIQMVSESRAFSARQALDAHLIDGVANNQQDLLTQMNNRQILLNSGQKVTLQSVSAQTETFEMSGQEQFLSLLNNPNIMYLLLLLGMMGILFEFFNPGGVAPGLIGIFCLILAGYGMSLLPVNFTGLALIILAIVLFILELKITSHGLLSIGGVISLFFGSVFLIKKEPSFDVIQISWAVLIPSVIVMALFFLVLIGIGLKAQLFRPAIGRNALIGMKGVAMEKLNLKGRVRVNGEFWDAVAEQGSEIAPGTEIEVVAVNRFQLTVKALSLTSK